MAGRPKRRMLKAALRHRKRKHKARDWKGNPKGHAEASRKGWKDSAKAGWAPKRRKAKRAVKKASAKKKRSAKRDPDGRDRDWKEKKPAKRHALAAHQGWVGHAPKGWKPKRPTWKGMLKGKKKPAAKKGRRG